MKTRVSRVDLAGAQGRILHFRGERMGNWITKNAQANRGINVARNIIPLLKISECVALGGLPCHSRWDSTTARVFCEGAKNERSTATLAVPPTHILLVGSKHCRRDTHVPHRQDACATLTSD
jgi:hypothetical protein